MNVTATTSLNALIQQGIQSQQQPKKPAAAPTPPPPAPATDSDGDNDGSRVGTQLNVQA